MEVIKSQRRLFLQPVVLQGLFFEQLFQEQHWFCLQFISPVSIFKLEEVAVEGGGGMSSQKTKMWTRLKQGSYRNERVQLCMHANVFGI